MSSDGTGTPDPGGGGIVRLIPLTGITLPFVSYGGSSVVANFILLAGLLLISNRANAPRT